MKTRKASPGQTAPDVRSASDRQDRGLLVNMILFPDMVQLDLTGPYEVLVRIPGARVELVGESLAPVRADRGLAILPTVAREQAVQADLLVVPGGVGVNRAMLDRAWVDFIARQGAGARWVFGICTGSLLLGAAGLLEGRASGGHWTARDLLARFGARVSHRRLTVDGNLFTAAGVTAGIDLALLVAAHVAGEETARRIQLQMEYAPRPPFNSGTPRTAGPETVEALLAAGAGARRERERIVEQAARNLAARKQAPGAGRG